MIHGPSDQLSTTTDTRTAVGRAPAAWNVQVAGVTASRIGEVFHRPLTAANATAPVWQNVVIQRDTGTPTTSQHFWYAPQNLAPVHDADGNLTNDGRWVYSWDAEQCDRIGSILDGGEAGARRVHLPMPRQMSQNRLVQMESTTQATAAGHPYTRLQFAYDWQGRRIARHVWQGGTQASPTFKSSHRWLYDGWNVITEFTAPSASSTTLTRLNTLTWGLDLSGTLQGAGGVGGLLVQTAVGGGVIERASYDGNGNIVAWTKSNAGAPTSRREYDAFGNTLVSEGAAPSTFGFSTKMQDVETGLHYYGYRYYDPVTGRWPSRDPIAERGGLNLYGFVHNDAIEHSDFLGMAKSQCCLKSLTINHRGVAGTTDMQHRFEIEALFTAKGTEKSSDDGETICCDPARCLTKQELFGRLSVGGIVYKNSATGTPLNQDWNTTELPTSSSNWADDGYSNTMFNDGTESGSDLDSSPERYHSFDHPGVEGHVSERIAMGFHFRFTVSDMDNTVLGRRHYAVFIVGGPESRKFSWVNFNNGTGSLTFKNGKPGPLETTLDHAPGLTQGGIFDPGPL